MSDVPEQFLDSRRNDPERSGRPWADYVVRLDDTEAIACSPIRHPLEFLAELGFTEVGIAHSKKPVGEGSDDVTIEEDLSAWEVLATKTFPDATLLISDNLGGELTLNAEIDDEGKRLLGVHFGGGTEQCFPTTDLNALAWGQLEAIHKALSETFLGNILPIQTNISSHR